MLRRELDGHATQRAHAGAGLGYDGSLSDVDDFGGFYDHVPVPPVDIYGFALACP